MLSSRRVLTLLGTCCAMAAVAMPVVALAHGGGGRQSARSLRGPERTCGEVGVSLGRGPHGGPYGNGHSSLSEAQVTALQTACNNLASAYATERGADACLELAQSR